jgi:hypothetical protein
VSAVWVSALVLPQAAERRAAAEAESDAQPVHSWLARDDWLPVERARRGGYWAAPQADDLPQACLAELPEDDSAQAWSVVLPEVEPVQVDYSVAQLAGGSALADSGG